MKNLKTFDQFVNEAVKVDNIKDLEKQLPKEFNVEDYLKAYDGYSGQVGSRLTLYDEIRRLAPEIPVEKLISKGVFWKNEKEKQEQGYGSDYRTKAEADAAYDKILDNDPGKLFKIGVDLKGKDKALKSYANMIIKSVGKLEAAKRVMYQSFSRADDEYDRHLIMDKFFKNRMRELWHNHDDVYYIKGVGSTPTKMRTIRGGDLKTYINDVGDKLKSLQSKNKVY